MADSKKPAPKDAAKKRAPRKTPPPKKTHQVAETVSAPPVVIVPPDIVNKVVEALLAGLSSYDVTVWIAERFPSYAVADVLHAVGAHFVRAGQAEPVAVRGFCIEAYRDLYRRSRAAGDLDTALKALAKLERTATG